MTLKKALEQYRERFGDAYPLMCRMGVDDSDKVAEILECLAQERPVKVNEIVDY